MAGGPQERRDVLGGGDGQRVDDPAAGQVAEVLGQPAQPSSALQPQHTEAQALALERAPLDEDVVRRPVDPDRQLLGDVVDDAWLAVAVVASTGTSGRRRVSASRMRR